MATDFGDHEFVELCEHFGIKDEHLQIRSDGLRVDLLGPEAKQAWRFWIGALRLCGSKSARIAAADRVIGTDGLTQPQRDLEYQKRVRKVMAKVSFT